MNLTTSEKFKCSCAGKFLRNLGDIIRNCYTSLEAINLGKGRERRNGNKFRYSRFSSSSGFFFMFYRISVQNVSHYTAGMNNSFQNWILKLL